MLLDKKFTRAIIRQPGSNFSSGISTAGLGAPDPAKTLQQHYLYHQALLQCGLEIIELDPEAAFPDAPFVEDTAVILDECAIISRPGDPSRRGEEQSIKKKLADFKPVLEIQHPGTLDGGDILQIGKMVYAGISGRTNGHGVAQLRQFLLEYGYHVLEVPVGDTLHLKSGVNHIGHDRIVIYEKWAAFEIFKGYQKITVGQAEAYSANCLFINDHLLYPAGFPDTRNKLLQLGVTLIELNMSEFQKMDGGLTCLSLRF